MFSEIEPAGQNKINLSLSIRTTRGFPNNLVLVLEAPYTHCARTMLEEMRKPMLVLIPSIMYQ